MKQTFFDIDSKLLDLDEQIINEIKGQFEKIDSIARFNQQKVLSAFIKHKVSEMHLGISTGYGYDDIGRDTLEKLWADCMGAQDSLIRHNFVSGTHTLCVALFGVLRPKDKMLCLTGRPYDTLIGVLGIDGHSDGSLKDFGIEYNQVDLNSDGTVNEEEVIKALKKDTYKMAYIQRSRGYSLRPSLSIKKIQRLCQIVKEISPETVIMVDNCYGEFVETKEPTEVGADIIAGSLIKNPGGGIAPTGGYIAGRSDLVEQCAFRLTAPGVGREVGATLGHNREMYMGVFAAPHTVGEALKTAVYCSALFSKLGYQVTPSPFEERADIIQAVILGNREALIAFCKGMQSGAPIDSFVSPEPWAMPGYSDEVIMAAGSFTLGASIELSADAPLREPFAAWMQGGLNFHSGQMGVLLAAQSMLKKGLLTL